MSLMELKYCAVPNPKDLKDEDTPIKTNVKNKKNLLQCLQVNI